MVGEEYESKKRGSGVCRLAKNKARLERRRKMATTTRREGAGGRSSIETWEIALGVAMAWAWHSKLIPLVVRSFHPSKITYPSPAFHCGDPTLSSWGHL
jgi:hypothetical protein